MEWHVVYLIYVYTRSSVLYTRYMCIYEVVLYTVYMCVHGVMCCTLVICVYMEWFVEHCMCMCNMYVYVCCTLVLYVSITWCVVPWVYVYTWTGVLYTGYLCSHGVVCVRSGVLCTEYMLCLHG